jgi:aminoglycoside phosphotransferase (APT) family kinase protein
VLAVRPELKLALLQPVGGVLSIPRLLVAHASGASGGVARAELEKAVELSARIAATLHELDAEIPATTTLDGELTTLAASLSIMQRLSPALAGAVEELLARLQARAAASATLPPVLCHGDYTPSQVVFDGAGSGVVDFDGVCFGEPALDLGQFCAHLRVACRKTARGRAQSRALEDRLCERFLTAYTRAAAIRPDDVAQLRERVAVYELVSLLGMGVRSWQQLKPQRTALVLAQLAERTAAPASPRE